MRRLVTSCSTAAVDLTPPASDALTRRSRFDFPGSDGTLAGLLETPKQGESKAVVLFAHCFTCGRDTLSAKYISAALTRNGLSCLRFDFTGLGASDGEFANSSFSSNVEDLVAAADHLRATVGAPAVLVGHSLGGAAVVAAAERVPECRAVAVVGAPFRPAHVLHNFEADLSRIEEHGQAVVKLAGRPFTIKKQFLDDVRDQDATKRIANLRRALLVMHSPVDETVGIENAADTFLAAKHPKSFVALDGASHLLANRKDALYAGDVIATWAQRYI